MTNDRPSCQFKCRPRIRFRLPLTVTIPAHRASAKTVPETYSATARWRISGEPLSAAIEEGCNMVQWRPRCRSGPLWGKGELVKVFISSVDADSKQEGLLQDVIRASDHQPLRFEDFGAQDLTNRGACGVELQDSRYFSYPRAELTARWMGGASLPLKRSSRLTADGLPQEVPSIFCDRLKPFPLSSLIPIDSLPSQTHRPLPRLLAAIPDPRMSCARAASSLVDHSGTCTKLVTLQAPRHPIRTFVGLTPFAWCLRRIWFIG
jgi:hypothetical protein